MIFHSFKDLVVFLEKKMYVEYGEAFTMAWELVVSKEILWDSESKGYIWPSNLTDEMLYDVLDIGLEKEMLPF